MTLPFWFLLAVGLCGLSLYLFEQILRWRHRRRIQRLQEENERIYADAMREERQKDLVAFQLKDRGRRHSVVGIRTPRELKDEDKYDSYVGGVKGRAS